MKIKRFVAAEMRAAMRAVRDEQGPNAVILSTRRVDGGVEVIAATDYDEALVQQAARREEQLAASVTLPAPPVVAEPTPAPAPVQKRAETRPRELPARNDNARATRAVISTVEDPAIRALRGELSDMKHVMQRELARMGDRTLRHSAGRTHALDELAAMGIEGEYARTIAACVPEDADPRKAHGLALGLLAKNLATAPADPIMDGGVIALVGPTGVGKTTTIAKLAARYAARHGARNVALLTTDNYRVGAREQLFTYGRLLGMPVIEANSGEDLRSRIDQLRDYKLVLVDTAGMSPRDRRLAAQLSWLEGVRTWLALPATAQGADVDATVNAFRVAKPFATILTKLDETCRLGTALAACARHQLPVAYVADGQRVPEDLHCHAPHQLVLKARELAHSNTQQQNNQQGDVAHAAA
jgi:flagellar biosynthesis protein FlhF